MASYKAITVKTNCSKIFIFTQIPYTNLFNGILVFIPVVYAQVDIEAVARLHFKIESQPNHWFEGFNSIPERVVFTISVTSQRSES